MWLRNLSCLRGAVCCLISKKCLMIPSSLGGRSISVGRQVGSETKIFAI